LFELEIEKIRKGKGKTNSQPKPSPNSTQTQPKPPQHSAQPAWPGPAAQPATWAQSRSIPAPRPNPAGPAHSSSPLRAARFALAPLWPSEHARPARSAASPPSRCQPGPTRQGRPLPPAPPRALNGNHRDLRRGPAKHASPRSPACPLLAPPRPQPCILSTHTPPANPSRLSPRSVRAEHGTAVATRRLAARPGPLRHRIRRRSSALVPVVSPRPPSTASTPARTDFAPETAPAGKRISRQLPPPATSAAP